MADETDYVEHASTYEAVRAIKREIGVISKSRSTNSTSEDYRYDFRGIEELLEVLDPLCAKHGVITSPMLIGESVATEYATKGGGTQHRVMSVYEVHARATADPTDVFVLGRWQGEAADSGDKASTKAGSVAYREVMFKAFSVATRGDDYDTERGDQEDKRAAGAADKAAAAEASQLASAKERGFEDLDDLDAAFDEVKAYGTGKTESAEWARTWAQRHGIRKGTLTAEFLASMTKVMSNAKQDGDWKANYTPPKQDPE